jgi:hypothetical protein
MYEKFPDNIHYPIGETGSLSSEIKNKGRNSYLTSIVLHSIGSSTLRN